MKAFFSVLLLLLSPLANAVESWEAGRIDYNEDSAEIAAFVNVPKNIQLQIVLCAKNEPLSYRFSLIFPESFDISSLFKVKISSGGESTQAFAQINGNTLDFQLDPLVFVNLSYVPDLAIEFEPDDAAFLGIPQTLNISMYDADIAIKQIAAECNYLCTNEDFSCEIPLVSAILWPHDGFMDDDTIKIDELCTQGSDKAYSFNLSEECKLALNNKFQSIGIEPLSFLDSLFHDENSAYVKFKNNWDNAIASIAKGKKAPEASQNAPDLNAQNQNTQENVNKEPPVNDPYADLKIEDRDWYLALYSFFGSRKVIEYPASYFEVLDLEEDPTTLLYNIDSRYEIEALKYTSVLMHNGKYDKKVTDLVNNSMLEWRDFYRDLIADLPLIKQAQALRPLLYRSMLNRLWILAGKPQTIELQQKHIFVQGTNHQLTTSDLLEKKCSYFDGVRGDEFFYATQECMSAINEELEKHDLLIDEYKVLKQRWDVFAKAWKNSIFYSDSQDEEVGESLQSGFSFTLLSTFKIYGYGDYFLLRDCISSRDLDICSFEEKGLHNTYNLELNNRLTAIDAVSKDDAKVLKDLSDKWQIYYKELKKYLQVLVNTHKLPQWQASFVLGVADIIQTNTVLNAAYYKEELPDITLDSFDGDLKEE